MLTGAAKKFKVPNSDDTDASRDWVAKSVLEMDENRKSWHPATTKATNARAKSTCTLQCTPLKCKAVASVAASSPSADADMEKAAICSSVQQREINSATLLLTTVQEVFTLVCKKEFSQFCTHTQIMNLMTQAPKKDFKRPDHDMLWYRRQWSEALDSVLKFRRLREVRG